jgi:hypothetical protein
MRLGLILLWFLFIASGSFWLPAYEGDVGNETTFVPLYAAVALLTAVGVRGRTESAHAALRSALPVMAVIGLAALTGFLMEEQRDELMRGGPLYLYFGIAVWASWAVLVLSTALASRTKWDGFWGIALGCVVAFAGWILVIAQVD